MTNWSHNGDMEAVFRALSDAHRRRILDLLREQDGQTTSAIEAHFAEMTRFGVIKHLKVLEAANLVTTRKVGRFKYHYLNPVPIQDIADRWIASFAAPWVQSLSHLKYQLERSPSSMTKPKHVYVTIIQTTPEKLWQALTDPTHSPQYYYGARLQTNLQPGSPFQYFTPDNQLMVGGTVLEAVAPERLVTSFEGHWDDAMQQDKPSRVTYHIEQQGEFCRLTVTHDEFEGETPTYHMVGGGWPGILSGLKTYLETGRALGYNPMALSV
ncbi:MAG: SRPBCC domain-containing protein [Candidatus Melainabacteria bacterium]|nr:SRPBCC domain-containing protein [Candidatus Melainabacteria bacterium]